MSFDADDVTNVQIAKQAVGFFPDGVLLDVHLEARAPILHVKKRGLSHAADGHDPSGDSQILRRSA